MSSKRYNTGDTVKKLCLYAMLCAVCMIIGYLESLFELSFIAPGVKIGLSNAVACVLIFCGDTKGAFAVNISRIILTNLLFGSPAAFCFAFAGAVLSLLSMRIMSACRRFSAVGASVAGGALHNMAQCLVALFFVGPGAIYYLPVLLVSGAAAGAFVGILASLIIKRVKKGENYV